MVAHMSSIFQRMKVDIRYTYPIPHGQVTAFKEDDFLLFHLWEQKAKYKDGTKKFSVCPYLITKSQHSAFQYSLSCQSPPPLIHFLSLSLSVIIFFIYNCQTTDLQRAGIKSSRQCLAQYLMQRELWLLKTIKSKLTN